MKGNENLASSKLLDDERSIIGPVLAVVAVAVGIFMLLSFFIMPSSWSFS